MFDVSKLDFTRLIIHKINKKEDGKDSAYCDFEKSLLPLNQETSELLKSRLTDAFGENSRSFDLELADTSEDSFFDLCKNMKSLNENDFINNSIKIANKLANNQKTSKIPGGYFVFIESKNTLTNTYTYFVIKAELHTALLFNNSNIQLLKDVFFTPSQKLYKIGVLSEKKSEYDKDQDPNENWLSILLDEQFSSKIASYFYKDFLGFSIDSNSAILSKRFFDETQKFIYNNVSDPDRIKSCLIFLDSLFINKKDVINPVDFLSSNITDDEKDLFNEHILTKFNKSIVKDCSLLERSLNKKSLNFGKNIKLSAPTQEFSESISIVNNISELNQYDFESSFCTIVKIIGNKNES